MCCRKDLLKQKQSIITFLKLLSLKKALRYLESLLKIQQKVKKLYTNHFVEFVFGDSFFDVKRARPFKTRVSSFDSNMGKNICIVPCDPYPIFDNI